MEENLVGYLLNALDTGTHKQVEGYLRDHPEAEKRLEALRQALEPLAADKELPDAEPGLVLRTVSRVAEYRCRPLPKAPAPPSIRAPAIGPRRWFRADVLVAASLLIVVTGVGFEFVGQLRHQHQKEACKNNLRDFHTALMTYSDQKGHFPKVPEEPPLNVAGMFVPMLRDAGCLGEVTIRCPGNGPRRPPEHSVEDLRRLAKESPEEFARVAHDLAGCYAYSLGYRDGNGKHHGLRPDMTDLNSDRVPILADRPMVRNGDRGNSPNHRGGQNVLAIGGNVRFYPSPNVGIDGDHIYLNREGKVAAGLDRWDSVLGASADRP